MKSNDTEALRRKYQYTHHLVSRSYCYTLHSM